MASIEEIQARRAARKAAHEAARVAQAERDLEALDALEVEHGDGRVAQLDLPSYVDGLPTTVLVRIPSGIEYKRFRDQVRRAKSQVDVGAAQDLLASVCVVYPDAATYERVREAFPGTHDSAAIAAIKLADAQRRDEGKG